MSRFILFLLSLLLLASAGFSSSDTLHVGLRLTPPFATLDDAGRPEGLAAGLFEEISLGLNRPWTWEAVELQELLDGIQEQRFDIGVGGLTITAEREEEMDFSHRFHSGGLGVAVHQQSDGLGPLRSLLSGPLLRVLGVLVIVLLLVGLLIWLLERRSNPDDFGGGALKGIGAGFWFSAVTMTTVGYGDKAPKSLGGRILTLFWMFAGLILASSFTAAITTALTVGRLESGISSLKDLRGQPVATLKESTAVDAVRDYGLAAVSFATIDECLDALQREEVRAVIYDSAILRYILLGGYPELRLLPDEFYVRHYGFLLPQDSPLREPLNRELLRVLEEERWISLKRRWLGQDQER